LFIDGRYYEQAEQEVNVASVEVVKVPLGTSISQALRESIEQQAPKKILLEKSRTRHSLAKALGERCALQHVDLGQLIKLGDVPRTQEIQFVPLSLTGATPAEKLASVLKDGEASFIATTDTI